MPGPEPPFAPLPAGRAWFVRPRAKAAAGMVVTGADRTAFLTRIMSGDLPKPPGAARTALLGPKGNLAAAAVATVLADRVFLDAEPARVAALRDGLDRYRITDAVEIAEDEAGECIGVFGECAAEVLADSPSAEGSAVADLAPGGTVETGAGFLRRDFRPWPSFTVRLPASAGEDAARGFSEGGASEASPEEIAYLRLAAGAPAWGAELSEASLPLAAGLAAHVRLGKGCYIGQEYVARQAHRGRVPRLLRQLRFAGAPSDPPPPGAPVRYDGESVAEITSSAPRPSDWDGEGPALALATLPAEIPPGASVHCGAAEATVHPLP